MIFVLAPNATLGKSLLLPGKCGGGGRLLTLSGDPPVPTGVAPTAKQMAQHSGHTPL